MSVEIARHWRLKKQRYQLTGSACTDCGQKMFPPREVCPRCARRESLPFPIEAASPEPRPIETAPAFA